MSERATLCFWASGEVETCIDTKAKKEAPITFKEGFLKATGIYTQVDISYEET